MTREIKFFLISFIVSLPFWWGINVLQENLEKFLYAQISQPFQEMVFVNIPEKPKKPELNLETRSAISVKIRNNGNQKILFQENIEDAFPIASLTKLMTAVIIFENTANQNVEENYSSSPSLLRRSSVYDFSKTITISKTAAAQDDVPVFGNLKSGDNLLLERAVELMLIYSSNDAAFALAEIIGQEYFVEKMNSKARELGLKNTHFVNPTGLDPENLRYAPALLNYFNYSTAEDLVQLTQYILKEHPKIFEISLTDGPYPTENGTSDLILPEEFKLLGGKTGYTDEAGGCMLLILENEKGSKLINVILGAPSPEDRITEMQKLIDWLSL